jgi:spermidine synthase
MKNDIQDTIITHRGTTVEMVKQADGTIACYMDGEIQSAESDEQLYHESLVQPVMNVAKKRERVMIIGGGEGATAREVLRWADVQRVDMYDWDKDIVHLFQTRYPQWGKGAWEDHRLHIHYDDIFQRIKLPPVSADRYDVIIVDLFDPSDENLMSWYDLLINLPQWIQPDGSLVLYAGTSDTDQVSKLQNIIEYYDVWQDTKVRLVPLHKKIKPYQVYIPCFEGYSNFLLLTPY